MRVIAVRRAREPGTTRVGDWVVSPGPQTELHAGDVLVAKGTREGSERLGGLAGVESAGP
jgi:uncharacterized protein with PhoU and TrkA domain